MVWKMSIQIPESPVKVKHDVVVDVKKLYPFDLEICVPKVDTQWSWNHFKQIHLKFHRRYGGVVEVEKIYFE